MGWRDEGPHPNAIGPKSYRHQQLARAAVALTGNRIGVVCSYARGKKVLDLGCVSHNFAFDRRNWLHEHVVRAAAECVGADYSAEGIARMRAAGYDVVQVDITGDLTPIVERGPFDVVVAGEIIEHLPAPQQLLAAAAEVLRPGGELVVTTPNPYSPRRARAGQRGVTWENVDHVVYLFPSGIAEMADRTGLTLTAFGTVGWPAPRPVRKELRESTGTLVRAARERLRGRRNPLATGRAALPVPTFWQSPLDVAVTAVRGRRMTRETAVYVLTKPVS